MTSILQSGSGPTLIHESNAWASGDNCVAGVDEVGRGPLAGPVVTAAVILDPDYIPSGLNDSKKLSEKKRDQLFDAICDMAYVAFASASARRIDTLNIREATLNAMVEAINSLSKRPDFVLVDGRDVPANLEIPAKAVIKGDSHSLSIAAASIVAKVTRDRMMIAAHRRYPAYGFDRHKGYASAFHREAIAIHGPCPLHRRSFDPVKSMVR